MLPSRCSQLPCTNSAVSGVERRARRAAVNSSAGITPQRSKYARLRGEQRVARCRRPG